MDRDLSTKRELNEKKKKREGEIRDEEKETIFLVFRFLGVWTITPLSFSFFFLNLVELGFFHLLPKSSDWPWAEGDHGSVKMIMWEGA